jgi:ArsR family transcriptional regulator
MTANTVLIALDESADRTRGCCARLEPSPLDASEEEAVVADLEALAHPIRLRLLAALAANPGRVCVCDLERIVPVKQPTVSHHLRILRKAGLVDSERQGLWAHYRLRREAVHALAARVGGALSILVACGSDECGPDTVEGGPDVVEE